MVYAPPMNAAENVDQASPEIDLDHYNDLSVGEILRRTREYYGQSLPQVEVNLRIRASQLQALEQGDIALLPGRVYAIGFVRAYSEYLGLDGDKMVQLFKAQIIGKRHKPELQFPVTYENSNAPNLWVITASLVLTILFIAYWTIFYTPTNYVEKIPPVPESLKQVTLALANPQPKIVEPPKPIAEPTVIEPANQMELIITADSWVEIKNAEGKKLISKVMKPGDRYIVPKDSDLSLTTGNAGGVMVVIDGVEITPIGDNAAVVRNVVLKPENFTNDG